jgi:hypothetical protein
MIGEYEKKSLYQRRMAYILSKQIDPSAALGMTVGGNPLKMTVVGA